MTKKIDNVRILNSPTKAPLKVKEPMYPPNEDLARFAQKIADMAMDGEIGGAIILYRKEDGFGHYLAPMSGAEENLAVAGMMDYIKHKFILTKITSS